MIVVQYILVAGAVANNIELAIRIGVQSAWAWACHSGAFPLGWVLYPLAVPAVVTGSGRNLSTMPPTSVVRKALMAATISGAGRTLPDRPIPRIAIGLQMLASFLALVHIVFGT